LGLNFFALSSDYRKNQIDEYYYLSTLFHVGYNDFMNMPVFVRRYLLDKWVEEHKKE
jgi:hypothetical protein